MAGGPTTAEDPGVLVVVVEIDRGYDFSGKEYQSVQHKWNKKSKKKKKKSTGAE